MTTFSEPGIFNVLDDLGLGWGMIPGPTGDPVKNAQALQYAIDLAQASGASNGAMILLPSFYDGSYMDYGDYRIAVKHTGDTAAIKIPNTGSSTALLIVGTGSGTGLSMETPGVTLFEVDSSSYVAFQDLTLIDASNEETIYGTAIHFSKAGTTQSEGYKIFRVNILNFPQAVKIGDSVVFVNVDQCNISYDANYSGVACVAVYTSGAQSNLANSSVTFSGGDTSGMIGLQIDASSYAKVTDTSISGFESGIIIGGGGNGRAVGPSLSAVNVDATGSCISFVPGVYDACLVNCTCVPTDASSPPSAAGISVGTTGENGDYDTIRFTACSVTGYGEHGLEISLGQNIQVNGGTYSGNGTAGIAIIGSVAEIQITGANCIGALASGPTQAYGIYITAGIDIQIAGANCSGNGTAGIRMLGAGLSDIQNVQILATSCQNSVLGETSQDYGIHISGASKVLIDACDLSENALYAVYIEIAKNVLLSACDVNSSVSGAKGVGLTNTSGIASQYIFVRGCNGSIYTSVSDFITVTGNFTSVEVTDCAGYNDLHHPVVAGSASAPSGTFSGHSNGYYGPTVFYLAGSAATTVTIDSASTHLTSGGFTLSPSETASIAAGTVTWFVMIGQ
jgi:hypothetical protein